MTFVPIRYKCTVCEEEVDTIPEVHECANKGSFIKYSHPNCIRYGTIISVEERSMFKYTCSGLKIWNSGNIVGEEWSTNDVTVMPYDEWRKELTERLNNLED